LGIGYQLFLYSLREVTVRCIQAVFLTTIILGLTSSIALAETRVALVIGNGAYQNVARLPNPPHDAADVAAALQRAGFDTKLSLDLDRAGMDVATIEFARAARTADVAIVYYSGHALQFGGVNYLAPVDAKLTDETDLRRMTRLDQIMADLSQAKTLRILVLDACRDNPFAEQLRRSIGTSRALPLLDGLAKMPSPEGMIIAYATQAGRTAEDGDGRNSPYTKAFLKRVNEKEEIGTIFRRISADVYETTKHAQLPELSLSLIGEFYLNGKNDVLVAVAPVAPWNSTRLDVAPTSRDRTPQIISISGKMVAVVNGSTKIRGALATTNNKRLPANEYKTALKIDGDRVHGEGTANNFDLECSLGNSVAKRYPDVGDQHVEMKCSYTRDGTFYNVDKTLRMWSDNSGGSTTSDVTHYYSQFSISGNSCTSIRETFLKKRDIQSLKFANTASHHQSDGDFSSARCEIISLK
jgi:hypothetical protein